MGRVYVGNAYSGDDRDPRSQWLIRGRDVPADKPSLQADKWGEKVAFHEVGESRSRADATPITKRTKSELRGEGRFVCGFYYTDQETGRVVEGEAVLEHNGDFFIWEPGMIHWWRCEKASEVRTIQG